MTGLEDAFVRLVGTNPTVQGLAGGLVIALFNTLGAFAILAWRNPSERALDGALGFAAGIMLTASFTSLILPGIEAGGLVPVLVGFAFGVLLLDRADAWVPHVHVLVTGDVRENGSPQASRSGDRGSGRVASVVLFVVAITLHNMPEGLAVGIGFGSGNIGNAVELMAAIALQNVPEGLAVAVAARNAGLGRKFNAAFTGARAGLVEIPLAVFGAWAVGWVEPLLPYGMGFAAGGMLYVVSDEILPETHARGYERTATLGVMIGVVVMLSLDVALG